ncbi:MAG: protein TonB [Sphingobacteriales bacterium]|jgi:protein TonB
MELKKNPKANLETRKKNFFLLGLVVALAVVLISFEYKVFERSATQMGELNLDIMEEEIIPISQTTPPPPPPPPPAPTTVIEIVDDEEEVEEIEIMDLEIDDDTEIEFVEPEEEVAEEEIFTIVEEMPEFPGGQSELFRYLGKSIRYPQMAQDAGITGTVFVTFVIDKDGKVKDARVLKGIKGGCDQEALRVVAAMPSWKPGKQRGKSVSVQYNLPIRFTLK